MASDNSDVLLEALERVSDVVVVFDQREVLHFINRAAETFWSTSRNDVLGQPLDMLWAELEPQKREQVTRIRRADGTAHHLSVTLRDFEVNGEKMVLAIAKEASGAPADGDEGDDDTSRAIRALQKDFLSELAEGKDLPTVADFLCRRIEMIAPDVVSSMLLVESQTLRPLAGPQLSDEFIRSVDGLPVAEGVGSCGTSAFRGTPVAVTDIENDKNWTGGAELALKNGLRACWSSPIVLGDGRVAGTFAFYFREKRAPSPLHERIVDSCLHMCRLAIEHDEARRKIAKLSLYDPLTGLPNRNNLVVEADVILNDARVSGEEIGFLAINVDRFRDISSSIGNVGDKVLLEISERLKAFSTNNLGIAGRLDGDTLALVVHDCGAERASQIAERVIAMFSDAIDVDAISISPNACIGISIFRNNPDNAETFLKQAEIAMYQAKETGRGVYRFFSAEMNGLAHERLLLAAALRRALNPNVLHLHFQPQIDLLTNQLHGVEALARWSDPTFGEVSPARFISLAEELGLIETIGEWSLHEALRQMQAWWRAGIDVPQVSVNLSPLHFRKITLPTEIADLLRTYDLPPSALTIEITENVMMDESAATMSALQHLHDIGVRISMDDFGTGFSSLASLANLPIDELKLDRSFMKNFETDPSTHAVATAVVRIGQSLGVTVVAEGVETEGQARLLRQFGGTVAQGYYFARPMPPQELVNWIIQTNALGTKASA